MTPLPTEGLPLTHGGPTPSTREVRLEAEVLRVLFRNAETWYSVLRCSTRGNEAPPRRNGHVPQRYMRGRRWRPAEGEITIVGKTLALPGEVLRATGYWTEHARFGEQFCASTIEVFSPSHQEGCIRLLSSGILHGIGRALAERIVRHFGEHVIAILDTTPERIEEVPGIGKAKAAEFIRAWRSHRFATGAIDVLIQLGVPHALALRAWTRFGADVRDLLTDDPYRLCLIDGCDLVVPDRVAWRLQIAPDDPRRWSGAAVLAMRAATERGHTGLPMNWLATRMRTILATSGITQWDERVLDGTINASTHDTTGETHKPRSTSFHPSQTISHDAFLKLATRGIARARDLGLIVCLGEGLDGFAFDADLFRLENRSAETIQERLRQMQLFGFDERDWAAGIAEAERGTGWSLTEQQRQAVRLPGESRVAIVTGGPGVGKTSIMRALYAVCGAARRRCVFAAPTGRAAKRLNEATGAPAYTIARLLHTARQGEATLDADLLVVDEASMVDVEMLHGLLELTPTANLLFVGDADQLPSIGPGAVLKDMLQSERVPHVRLSHVFRQGQGSPIVQAAHDVLAGRRVSVPNSPHFAIARARSAKEALELVERVLRRYADEEIQLISPMRRGALGMTAINRMMQTRSTSGTGVHGPHGVEFRQGDKVIHTKNNYALGIMNGEIGRVTEVDTTSSTVIVQYETQTARYDFGTLHELDLAYCVTVHKSQGSQFEVVVILMSSEHADMWTRRMLYTAITRARKRCFIIAEPGMLEHAIGRDHDQQRITWLGSALRTPQGSSQATHTDDDD